MRGEENLADVRPRREVRMGIRGGVEREGGVDHRLDSGRIELQQVFPEACGRSAADAA